ncbi:DUF4386 domain-containing protein [Isoptericola aurantiacus]|uniref:DUF4386 domain-containing protein n=1 Tax=Isoptericola aurantiacus TaxID=3377839 RepID=UPI00383B02CD
MDQRLSRRDARTTAWLYLAMAVTGMAGFLTVRPRLYDAADPGATTANLVDGELLARLGISLELGLVISQALAALWFYRLFRSVDAFAAGAVAAFGTVNAIAVLGSAAALGVSLETALAGDAAAPHLMFLLAENFWAVGAVFFGLWLVPMGVLALRSGMPRALGWFLVGGGVGYVLSAFVGYLAPAADAVAEVLTIPATIGEFWMIALLLWIGFRPAPAESPGTRETVLES